MAVMDSPGWAAVQAPDQPHENDGLTFVPAWRIAELIASREVSAAEVTEHFLARIETLDPEIHAFRTIDRQSARDQARAADEAVQSGMPLGPLHGVPLALKEHVPVAGHNYWNSFNGRHGIATRDGIEAERLRAAGAILFGTTVAGLTAREFGDSPQQPQNPWDRGRVCGDSSSGSAAAVAAGLVPAAIAVDGLGSTRLPAAFCGLVGLNPTRGRVPWTSWSAINPRLLSNSGPLTRDVRDAALIMQVLAGRDGRDLMSRPDEPPDYSADLSKGVAGLQLGWSEDPFEATQYAGPHSANVIAKVRDAGAFLERAGANITAFEDKVQGVGAAALTIMGADRTMAARIEVSEDEVVRAKDGRKQAMDWLDGLFERYDVLITPTAQIVAPTRQEWAQAWGEPGYMLNYAAYTAISNLTGYPALSVPAGLVNGLPVGLQFMGPPDSGRCCFALRNVSCKNCSPLKSQVLRRCADRSMVTR